MIPYLVAYYKPCLRLVVTNRCFLLGPYPVVPSFQDWEFPHDRIPSSWSRMVPPVLRDRRCRVTNVSYPLEDAHLVLKEEEVWYRRNEMDRYSYGSFRDINNARNILPLRPDIHIIFDDRHFVIVPKVTEAGTFQHVTHIISSKVADYWPSHHNTIVQCLSEESQPYLFARFAWAILLQVKHFVTDGQSRAVRIRTTTIGIDGVEGVEYKTEFLTGPRLKKEYGGGGSQAATPFKKRSRTGSVMEEEDSIESSSEDEDVDSMWDVLVDCERREKRQKEQRSSDTLFETEPYPSGEVKGVMLGDISAQQTTPQSMEWTVFPLRSR